MHGAIAPVCQFLLVEGPGAVGIGRVVARCPWTLSRSRSLYRRPGKRVRIHPTFISATKTRHIKPIHTPSEPSPYKSAIISKSHLISPTTNPPFPTAKDLSFQSSGKKSPKLYAEIGLDGTFICTAQRVLRTTGEVGYAMFPGGTVKVVFAWMDLEKTTDAFVGRRAWKAGLEHGNDAVASGKVAKSRLDFMMMASECRGLEGRKCQLEDMEQRQRQARNRVRVCILFV